MKCLKMSKVWILMQMNATYRPYKTQTDNIFLKKYQAIWKQERTGEWLKRTDHSYPERLLIQENVNWVQWHTHVIPVLWEDKAGQYLMSASPMQFSDLVNSTSKNKKGLEQLSMKLLASILSTVERETHRQMGRKTEMPPLSGKGLIIQYVTSTIYAKQNTFMVQIMLFKTFLNCKRSIVTILNFSTK